MRPPVGREAPACPTRVRRVAEGDCRHMPFVMNVTFMSNVDDERHKHHFPCVGRGWRMIAVGDEAPTVSHIAGMAAQGRGVGLLIRRGRGSGDGC